MSDDTNQVPARFQAAIRHFVDDLAAGRYRQLEADGRAGRLGAKGLRFAVERYGRALIPLPAAAFARGLADAVEVTIRPGQWHVDIDLWTEEEGRSDLTLSLDVIESEDGVLVRADDLHVL
jgi:hypothetical protein